MSSTAKKIVKKPAAHPAYKDMVKKAIVELKERNGSSRQAIIKYIRANFKVTATENVESFVRRSLVTGVKAGRLVHTKGAGASGSFKLAEKAKAVVKPKVKKTSKKKPVAKKSAAKPKEKKIKKTKTPKKTAKSPKKATKKPKTPKRAGAKKAKTPKKTAKA